MKRGNDVIVWSMLLSLCVPALNAWPLGDAAPPPPTTAAGSGPLLVAEQLSYDFGEVWAGARIEHTFTIRNDGDEVLTIFDVKPTCSCTVTPDFSRVIKPGETGRLPAIVATDKLKDKVKKDLVVTTNAANTPTITLTLTGFVKTVAQITPIGKNFFGMVAADERRRTEFRIVSKLDRPIKLTLEPVPAGPFKAEVKEMKEGKEYVVTATCEPPYQEGANQVTLRFKTDVPEKPVFEVPLSANLQPRLLITAPVWKVDGNQRENQTRVCRIKNNGPQQLFIHSVKASNPIFNPKLTSKMPNDFMLEVTIPAFWRPESNKEYVLLETNDPERKEIRIPILPYGKPPPPEVVAEGLKRLQATATTTSAPAGP